MIKLTCIRHTKVDVPSGTCYGQTDVPLAATYAEERKSIDEQIRMLRFDKVFSSPLSRCKKLAADLFPQYEVRLDERLKELHFGQWETKGWEEIFFTEAGKHWMDHFLELPCPGGESYEDFRERVASFLDDLCKKFTGSIALVTHSGVIRLIKSILDNESIEEIFESFNPTYGGVYSFEIEK
jgi:alpha-ribazole phosphatase